MTQTQQYSVEILDHHVPAFAEAEIDRLYGARYASLVHLALYAPLSEASTFIARRDGVIVALLLFVRRGGVVRVLNEGMALETQHAALFAAHLFRGERPPQLVQFEAVETVPQRLPFPAQSGICAIDTAMPIAATADAWLASLGSNTRSNLRRYVRRLREAEPSFVFDVAERDQVDPEDVRTIIRFNRLRMVMKNKQSGIDRAEEDAIVEYVRRCGFVGIARIGGALCAGVILYRQGKNFTLRTLAHAESHSPLHIGTACAFLTLSAAIPHGRGGNFYFGWGNEDYKFRFGAHTRELRRLLIYRSPLAMLRYAPLAVRTLGTSSTFAARNLLVAAANSKGGAAATLLSWLRNARTAVR